MKRAACELEYRADSVVGQTVRREILGGRAPTLACFLENGKQAWLRFGAAEPRVCAHHKRALALAHSHHSVRTTDSDGPQMTRIVDRAPPPPQPSSLLRLRFMLRLLLLLP